MGRDDQVRRAVADGLAGLGLPGTRVAREVLLLLPEDFVRAYEEVVHEALKFGDEGKGQLDVQKAEVGRGKDQVQRTRVSSGQKEQMPSAKSAKARGVSRGWTVKDERALGRKAAVDRALRKLARDLARPTEKADARRCSKRGCRRFADREWKYCPSCGTQLAVDEVAG